MFVLPSVYRIVFSRSYQQKVRSFFRVTVCAVLASVLSSPLLAANKIVRMETSAGAFNIELYDADAPETVTNFLKYVGRGDASNGGYNGTFIHRSEPGFVIQGGGFFCPFVTSPSCHIATDPSIPNEYSSTRPNIRGTISMALSSDQFGNVLPDSATSEWFINLSDANSAGLVGFTVFGKVLGSGMDVVDAIAALDRTPLPFSPFQAPTINNSYVYINQICINNDNDAVCPQIEDLAPNNGDGNEDGIPDREQANVTTIQKFLGSTATFAANLDMTLSSAGTYNVNDTMTLLAEFTPQPKYPVKYVAGILAFRADRSTGPADGTITLFHGSTEVPNRYYVYGKTLDNPTDHWYDFSFDGTTGAEIKGDRILLHFVDGERGDNDLAANNSIAHTGTAVLATEFVPIDNGSGCTIAAKLSKTTDNGDWILISMFLVFVALVRRRVRH